MWHVQWTEAGKKVIGEGEERVRERERAGEKEREREKRERGKVVRLSHVGGSY